MPFTDVSGTAWYYSDVKAAWDLGLIRGITASIYAPSFSTTRAQIVAVLHRLMGNAAPTVSSVRFDDVDEDAWYYDDIRWAQGMDIIQGSDDDHDGIYSFRPEDTVTRQEFMAILYRCAVQNSLNTSLRASLSSFPDNGMVSSWAQEAMSWSVAAGLQQGVGDITGAAYLSPTDSVTRAQLAAFIHRFADMLH